MAKLFNDLFSDGIHTERLKLIPAGEHFVHDLRDYYECNRQHLQPWEPLRPDHFFEIGSIARRPRDMTHQHESGTAVHLLLRRIETDELVGECNFSNIVLGPFQACHLGFSIAKRAQTQGLMREALSAAIERMFAQAGLHRIMANYRPENARSAALLQRLGFEREGMARSYLKINGAWADHVLTSRINPTQQD
jgi:[ribosomal protein S5]-alanine N-acetyltransferase